MPRPELAAPPRPAPPAALAGKKLWIPPMSAGGARALAAAFHSMGIDAACTPPSDERTRELGARYTSGDECYPTKVTLGDFLKVLEQPGNDQNKTAFFMATGQGPCRFGQYAPHLESIFRALGYSGVTLISPASESGYSDFGEASSIFVRHAWRAIVASDILLKYLLKTRPYEPSRGAADVVYEASLSDLCCVLEVPYRSSSLGRKAVRESLLRSRARFRDLPVRREKDRPLIGIVGEIFCRMNTFSNDELVRRLEDAGAEVWLNDVSEWIWYTNHEQRRMLGLEGKRFSREALAARLRTHFQRQEEHALASLFRQDFRGYEEPRDVTEILGLAGPYLPAAGSSGEMVINVGKAIYFARKGLDGVIDISPFTCMNAIICEAIYPHVSRDCGGIPMRNFYFDGTQSDIERDIGIFLELARNYHQRKSWPRRRDA